jgi:hypothetical protein
VLCAAGYNIRWLLRMIVKKAEPFFATVAGSGFDRFHRFAAQIKPDLERQSEQVRLDELGGGLKVDISGATRYSVPTLKNYI